MHAIENKMILIKHPEIFGRIFIDMQDLFYDQVINEKVLHSLLYW